MPPDDEPGRRDLIRYAGAVAVLALPACRGRLEEGPAEEGSVDAMFALPARELEELTIAQLQQRMASGAESAASLVDKYRRRIEATNDRGPKLRAVLELH